MQAKYHNSALLWLSLALLIVSARPYTFLQLGINPIGPPDFFFRGRSSLYFDLNSPFSSSWFPPLPDTRYSSSGIGNAPKIVWYPPCTL